MHLNFNQWIPVSKSQFTRGQINRYASSFFREDPMGLAYRKFDYTSLLADVLLWLRLFPYSNVGIVIGWLSSASFSRLSTVTKNKWWARGRIRKWISSPWKADEELHYIFLLYRGIALKSRGKFDFRKLWNYWEKDLIYYQIYYKQRYLIIRIITGNF